MVRISAIVSCLVFWLLSLPAFSAQGDRLGEWQRVQDSGVTIEFQAGYENIARQLLPVVVARVKSFPVMGGPQHLARFQELALNKGKVMQFMATQMGLETPGKVMSETYDAVIGELQKISLSIPDPHTIRLWPRETLVSMLSNGVPVPGWSYDQKEDKVEFTALMGPDGGAAVRQPLPVVVVKGDSTSKVIDTADGMVVSFYLRFRDLLYPAQTVYNQSATAGISADIGLSTAFARWFCEGAASLIAWQCTNAFPGQTVDPIPPVWRDFKRFEPRKGNVNLLGWRALAWEREMPTQMDSDLAAAHTACSLHEIQGIVGRHGAQTMPSILKEFGKSDSRDTPAIINAIKTVTGEDIRPVLAAYGSLDRDTFKGVAVRDIGVASAVKQGDGQMGLSKDSQSLPLIMDGNHGIALHFVYETLSQPLDARAELVSSIGAVALAEDMKLTNVMGQTVWHPLFTDSVTPGDYKVKLYIRGKLFRELPIKLVAAPPAS